MEEHEMTVAFGGALKALGGGRVEGSLVIFGDPEQVDLEGDYFTKETEFELEEGDQVRVYYQHGMDAMLGKRSIGRATLRKTGVGVWMEAQLNLRDAYEKAIYRMIEHGKMGLSSGALSHLVEHEMVGKSQWIKRWVIGEASITPTPAEPRTTVMAMKGYQQFLDEVSNAGKAGVESNAEVAGSTADAEAGADRADAMRLTTREVVNMSEGIEAIVTDAVTKAMTGVTSNLGDLIDERVQALVETVPAQKGALQVPNVKQVTKLGFSDERNQAFKHYIRTGDNAAVKAALQEGTDSEGGVLVPPDHFSGIVAKRDELAIPIRAGVRQFTTSRDVFNIPYEDTSMTGFVLTAEEGAADENEPTFGNIAVRLYKYTKTIKISTELASDEDANLFEFLDNAIGRAYADTLNDIFLNGTGSGQPQGVIAGGTANADHFAATGAVTAAEIMSGIGALGEPYHEGSVWLMRYLTLNSIRSLTGNPFLFQATPAGERNMLVDFPVHTTNKVPAMGADANSILLGNPEFWALVQNRNMEVVRLNELYRVNGQIGLLYEFRVGGAVLQSEAWQVLNHADS